MHRRVTRRRLLALAMATPFGLAGCGGVGGNGAAPAGSIPVTVGLIPIVDVAPIHLGVDRGFFAEEGLDLAIQNEQGGAAIVPGVMSGKYQFGFSNVTSLLVSLQQGEPIKVVGNGVNSTGEPGADFGALVVAADSPIRSAADLTGKKVAVNTLKNINTTTTNASVRAAGGDPTGIEFVAMPFPAIPDAVAAGTVDAGQLVEPYLTIAKRMGNREIADNYIDAAPNLPVALYFTSAEFAQSNPEVVAAFSRAVARSLEFAQGHPEEARDILIEYTDMEAVAREAVTLPSWPTRVNPAGVKVLGDLAVRDGLLPALPDLKAMLP